MTTSGDTVYTEILQTHYEDCWRDPRHHACAIAEIERLREQITTVNKSRVHWRNTAEKQEEEIERLRGLLREAVDMYSDTPWVEVYWLKRVREALGDHYD